MSQVNCRRTPYGERNDCRAWLLYLKENWTPANGVTVSARHQRRELLKRWENAEQEFRDIYIRRAMEEEPEEDRVNYHPDIPLNDFRRILDQYPCVRIYFNEADPYIWEKLHLFLQLDEHVSPLHDSELPQIVEIRDNFHLEDYSRRFILDDANFEMMGSSDFGHPVIYYHILMIIDEQTFRDGTLLHVDFNRSGDPELSIRYSAIRCFFPWKLHHDSPDLRLEKVNEYMQENGYSHQILDLSRPVVRVLKDEMEARGVNAEEANLTQLAIEAVTTVNAHLLEI